MSRSEPDDLMLMAYADGELDTQAAAEVEAALMANPALAERVAMFVESAEMLRAGLGEPEPVAVPATLQRQMTRAIWTTRARSSVRYALPVAAAIAGFVIGGTYAPHLMFGVGVSTAQNQVEAVMHEVAEYHAVFVRESEHLVEVPASRRDHIEAWLGNRVGYPLHVPDLSTQGLQFLGARMLAVAGKPVAQLMYTTASGERVALCVTEQGADASTALMRISDAGFDVYGQGQGKHLFIIAAPADSSVARRLSGNITGLMQRG
jgi:anti-sigma factor RsiW